MQWKELLASSGSSTEGREDTKELRTACREQPPAPAWKASSPKAGVTTMDCWVSWNGLAGRDCPLVGPEFKGEPWSGEILGLLHTAGGDASCWQWCHGSRKA